MFMKSARKMVAIDNQNLLLLGDLRYGTESQEILLVDCAESQDYVKISLRSGY